MARMEHKCERRINLRVDPDREARLRAAAEANGESLTGFLLAAGTDRAEAVLERASRIALCATAFERFVAALDAEPEPMQLSSGTPPSQALFRLGDSGRPAAGRAALGRP